MTMATEFKPQGNECNTEQQQRVERLEMDIEEQRSRIRTNSYTIGQVDDAISHHLEQLTKLGATLEDDICQLLRKVREQAEASQRLEELLSELETINSQG